MHSPIPWGSFSYNITDSSGKVIGWFDTEVTTEEEDEANVALVTEAVNKQVPRFPETPPGSVSGTKVCPKCKNALVAYEKHKYCPNCGQRLHWPGVPDDD